MRDYVVSILSPFIEGSSYRGYCPLCSGQDTFTALLSDGLCVYNCYRAGCSNRGAIPINLSAEDRITYLKKRKELKDRGNTTFIVPNHWIDGLGDGSVAYMETNNMLEVYKRGLFRPMYDTAERRFVFPIKDKNEVIGAVGRTLVGSRLKTKNYNDSYSTPFTCGIGDVAFLVEDCASAVAAARDDRVTGVALLGTNLRKEFIPYLSPYRWVGICLDPDAYSKSLKLKQQLQPYVKDVRVLKLSKDIKNMNDGEYREFLERPLT